MRPRPRPRARPAFAAEAEGEASSRAVGLYVHIPYCRRRCRYCDFAIVPVGTGAAAAAAAAAGGGRNGEGFVRMDEAYRDAVLAEVDLIGRARRAAGEGDARLPLRSVYFGGGTPSLAPAETLTAILGSVLAPPGGGRAVLRPSRRK